MIKIIPIETLHIPANRQRRTFSEAHITALAESIQTLGLLHPPVVRETPEGFELVAGERRCRAVVSLTQLDIPFTCGGADIPLGHIAVLPLGALDYVSAKQAELEENIIRVDLTWQERAEATQELRDLQVQAALAAGQKPPTVTDTAKYIAGADYGDSDRIALANTLVVAEHLTDPEVAKAKSEAEAMKIIKKKAAAQHRRALAERFEAAESQHTLIHGNAAEELPRIPAESVDVILTDPPYGIGADQFGEQSSTGHDYKDSREYFESLVLPTLHEFYRIAKPDAHLYLFCDPRMFPALSFEAALAGWQVWHVPLIWNKQNGMLPQPDYGPRRTYETILFARKGDRRVTKVAPDVLTVAPDASLAHGAQKPVDLYSELLARSTSPGDTVLDAFAGSGPIFPAAERNHCTAIGIELNIDSHALCVQRITQLGVTL